MAENVPYILLALGMTAAVVNALFGRVIRGKLAALLIGTADAAVLNTDPILPEGFEAGGLAVGQRCPFRECGAPAAPDPVFRLAVWIGPNLRAGYSYKCGCRTVCIEDAIHGRRGWFVCQVRACTRGT